MLIEPQAESVFDDTGHKRCSLPRREALFGLAGELRVTYLGREHIAASLPDVVWRQLNATRQQAAQFTKFAHRVQQPGPHTVDMGAALNCGNQVDVRLGRDVTAFWQPLHGPVHAFITATEAADEGLFGNNRKVDGGIRQIVLEPVFEIPLFRLVFLLILELDSQARAQHRLSPQYVPQPGYGKVNRIEILGIGRKGQRRAGIALATTADNHQLRFLFSARECHAVNIAVAADHHFQSAGQRIDHRHTHTVQPATELIVFIRKLTAGMQRAENDFYPRLFFSGMQVDRHTATIVSHRD